MADTASRAIANYTAAMQSGQTQKKYQDGIDGYAGNPMEEAAKAEALYLQRVTEASTSGRRAAALRAVPRDRWATNAKTIGSQRLTSGAQKAMDKVRAHFQKWGPIYDQIKQTCRAMPKGTTADSIARVAMAIQMAKQAAGKPA